MNSTHTTTTRRQAIVILLCGTAAFAATTAVATPADRPTTALPGNSIYQLPIPLTDQDGRIASLSERRGQPMLISMFYTSCQSVCPMLVEALRETQSKLSIDEQARMSVLMVSFDPVHDTVAVLKQTATERNLDSSHWTLARTDGASARKLAAVLGIQYRALANGDFNHTTALILVDGEGRIAGRTSRLGDADPAFVKRVKASLHEAAR